MEKIKALFEKHREIVMYLIFGVLTTLVGWVIYFAVFWSFKAIFDIPPEDTSGALYLTGYTLAQIIQWVGAVLFAFFTNRKWVFTDAEKNVPISRQLPTFAGARLLTLGIDYVVTYFGAMALSGLFPAIVAYEIFGLELNLADIISKLCAAVIVIICNYIFSKLFVFKKAKQK